MSNFKSGIELAEKMGYYALPEKIHQVDKLIDYGMKGMVVCPGGDNSSLWVAKHVVASGYPCVALASGMAGMERLFRGSEVDVEQAKNVIETMNKLELVCLIILESRGQSTYFNLIDRLQSAKFTNIPDAEEQLKKL